MIYNEDASSQLKELYSEFDKITLNEMNISVHGHLSNEVEHSIYYNKLKVLLHPEIVNFCKEQLELKEDLNVFRMMIGKNIDEREIKEYLDSLKLKYNGTKNSKIGLDYHIEITRIDYGVALFCVLLRGSDVHMKKFVFRFRKANITNGLDNLTVSQIPLDSLKGDSKDSKM